jgi:hypothetical protein
MRMKNLACILLLVAASGCEKDDPLFCKKNPGASGCPMPDGYVPDDGDLPPDMDPSIDAQMCFGADTYAFCLNALPAAPVVIADNSTLNTGTDSRCQAPPTGWTTTNAQPDACFIIGTSINITNLAVTGTKPLVLLATNTVTINGLVDAASHRTGNKLGPGAPASTTSCPAYPTTPSDNMAGSAGGGGGGAGASFMSAGRNGGAGDNTVSSGGTAFAALNTGPTTLRAGCNGQDGGGGDGASGAVAGGGGGAVFVLAGNSITFGAAGIINASGGGSTAAGDQAGGAGGGSGGMIVLYSHNAIMATTGAKLIANGGGGGSGGNNGGGTVGNEPGTADPSVPAGTATGCGGCGTGGRGAAQGTPAEIGGEGADNVGGGGGGGGLGYIVSNKTLSNIATSPTATIIPN